MRRFDRLFLQYMIRHHEGAVIMVEDLLSDAAGGQEPAIFQLAQHIAIRPADRDLPDEAPARRAVATRAEERAFRRALERAGPGADLTVDTDAPGQRPQ